MNWEHTEKVLNDLGNELAELYKQKLANEGVNTSKMSLSNSVKPVIDKGENFIELGISLLYYWKYIEEGRPPTTNSGDGTVRKKILEWIKEKPITPYPDEKGKVPTEEQLSYMIANKIHKYGWYNQKSGDGYTQFQGKHLMSTSIEEIKVKYMDLIDEAITQDLSEDIDFIFASIK